MDCTLCKKQRELLEGLCERCYHKQRIAPLLKERENSQLIIDQLTTQIKLFSSELNRAKLLVDNRTPIDVLSLKMAERRRNVREGSVAALKYHFCRKCYSPFDSGIECITHEENCVVVKYNKEPKTKPAKQVLAQTVEELD